MHKKPAFLLKSIGIVDQPKGPRKNRNFKQVNFDIKHSNTDNKKKKKP